MKGYINQKGCYCCYHIFTKYDFDADDEYYCNNHDAGSRPICGSFAMNERKDFSLKEWMTWAKKREVYPWGICNQFRYYKEE